MNEPFGPLRWVECHAGTLVAAQNLLLLATIIVAIAIPLRLEILSRAERRSERRALTNAFLTTVEIHASHLAFDFPRVKTQLDVIEASPEGNPELPSMLQRAKISIPQALKDAFGRMHEFSESTTEPLRYFVAGLLDFNAIIDSLAETDREHVVHFDNAAIVKDLLRPRADQLEQRLNAILGWNNLTDDQTTAQGRYGSTESKFKLVDPES